MNRDDELVAKGRALVEAGRYAPPRGDCLGTLERWWLPVYEGSPQEWRDALAAQLGAEVDT